MFGSGPGSSVLEFDDGVVATIVPSARSRSLFNAVVYDRARPGGLVGAIDDIRSAYDEAGIFAWSVWVVEGDEEPEGVVSTLGMKLDSVPRAMGAPLGEIDLTADTSAVIESRSLSEVARVNELGWGVPPGMFRALGEVEFPDEAHVHLALVNERPVASVVTFDYEDGDCCVYWVATEPGYGRRGFARATLTAALESAIDRGCATTTLQGSPKGAPLYADMGYRDLGVAVNLWELRKAKPE
jgi:GNAT superfamily N-acetyltransferase